MPNPSDIPGQFARYHRQMLLPGIGVEGQRRLAAGHALIVGCGALGCTSAELLARAGVGTLTIVDRDVVESTNLQRQILFDETDAAEGLPKAEAARRRLAHINSGVRVHAIVADFTHRNAERMLLDASRGTPDLLIDGTDNFETRYLLNDLSVKHALPYLYAGAVGTSGMSATFVPPGACLRCVFDELPAPGSVETCDTAGVLGPAVTIVASCQAADAIKLLAGLADKLSPTLLDFDLWTNRRRRLELSESKRSDCVCCGGRRFEFLEGLHASRTVKLCGQNAVQIAPANRDGQLPMNLDLLKAKLAPLADGPVVSNGFLLRAKVGDGAGYELTVFEDGRTVVKGTESPEIARSVYARYVGA